MLSKSIKKVIIATLVALVMGTSIVLPSSLIVPISVEAAVINAQSGNLTVTASSLWAYGSANWSNKTRTFTKGTSLTVLEKHSVDGREMYKLSNGLYISANPAYVSFKANGSAPVPAPAPSQSSTMTTTQNLNLRRGATTSHGIILTISKGAQVQIISMSGEWANVNYQGKVGYVSSQYLSGSIVTTPTPAPTPTPTPPVQLPSSGSQMRETTANLNMRNGASTSSKIMLTIPRGSSVTILSESAGWAKVSYAGKEGHVSSTYLKSTVATQEPTAPPAVETPSSSDERKTTQNLNMRNGAGTGNAVLLTIPKGSLVSVLSESDGWAKLSFGGKVGYASTSYLEKVAATPSTPAPEPTPVPTPNPEPTPPAEVIPEPTPTPQPQPGPGESVNGKDMRIITGSLYMRSGADDNASIITILSQGTIVEVESLDGKWAKITHEGVPGYASTKFMSPYSGTTPEVPSEKPPVVGEDIRENTFNLNMRKGPGTEHAVLVTIPQGTLLTITEIDGYWAKVTYNGQTGYVSTDYLIKVTYPSTGGQDDSGLQGKLDGIDAVNYNNEDILVSGFAKIASGVKEVKVYLNSKVQGTATYGINRADDGNSLTGYRYTIKRNNLFPGENKILVVVSGNEGERFTYTKTIQVNKVPLIVIDPGHGGKDSGAAGFLYGMKVYEKTYVLQFAAALNEALSSSGFNTIMTRNNDRFIELSDRARMADNNHADLLFSLHHDYNGNSDTKGAFVIYPSYKSSSISQSTVDESKDVADYVKNSLMDLGFVNRRNGTDQSISGHSLAVLRQSQTRSILAEMGYMSNAEDLSKISDPVFQKAMANNLTKQLKAYFKMN